MSIPLDSVLFSLKLEGLEKPVCWRAAMWNVKKKNMNNERVKLKSVELHGFKSIHPDGQRVAFGDRTILIGANGSGKSNLVSFFKMLDFVTMGGLQTFVQKQGGADALLHYGAKVTEKIEFLLTFEGGERETGYLVTMAYGMPDRLFFASERVMVQQTALAQSEDYFIEAGKSESGLLADSAHTTSKVLSALLAGIRAYHFHDTSDTAKIKSNGYIEDARYLRADAGNLAAFLRALKNSSDTLRYYERIIRHIRHVMPQFRDFELEPVQANERSVMLNWSDVSHEHLFGPHQISDGSLRFMALATLLLQPPEMLPNVVVLDEPELGLHPAAVAELAGMIRSASRYCQVIVATQSIALVDEFQVEELVVTEWDELHCRTVFRSLDEELLREWLERYTLSELWEKNVLGGRP